MQVRLPKPLHGWRRFTGEVGVIVLGVLIALAAQQAVEAVHWRNMLSESEDAIRHELRDDDLPQAFARAAMAQCLDEQLDKIQQAVEAGADRVRIASLADDYRPPRVTWDADAWDSAVSSEAAVRAGSTRMLKWAVTYRQIETLGENNFQEARDLAPLRAGRRSPGPLSAAEEERVLLALETLRQDNVYMSRNSRLALQDAAQVGIAVPSAVQAEILNDGQKAYGRCVLRPPFKKIDPSRQFKQVTAPGL
jgi:hypothetical protein